MMNVMKTWIKWLLLVTLSVWSDICLGDVIDVTQRGAKGDAVTDNTEPIQKAVDECAQKGGGIVLVPSGRARWKSDFSVWQ